MWNCIIIVWGRMEGRKNPVWPERWKMPQLGDYWSKITDYCSPTPNFNPWWSACLKKMTFSFVAMKTQHTYVWPWPWKMGQLVKHKRLLLRGWDQTQPSLVGLARIGRRWLAEPAVADDICSGAICNSLRWKVPPFYSSANPFKWPALLLDIHLCTVGGRGSNQRYKLLWRAGKWKLSSKWKQSQAAH